MVLSLLSYFDYDDERIDTRCAIICSRVQMPDGGWNCRRPPGATHSSVHTTISALEGLRLYETGRRRKVKAVRAAQSRGREFLLEHRLFRSHRTGEVINPVFTALRVPAALALRRAARSRLLPGGRRARVTSASRTPSSWCGGAG